MFSFIILLVSLLLVSFFSGMQHALQESNKLKLELDKRKLGLKAKILTLFVSKSGMFAISLRLWHMLAIITFGLAAFHIISTSLPPLHHGVVPFAQVALVFLFAILLAVLSEFSSYYFVISDPNKALEKNLYILLPFFAVCLPFLYLIPSPRWRKRGSHDPRNTSETIGKHDLDNLLTHSREELTSQNRYLLILKKALDFSDIRTRDCMVPRTDITAIDKGQSIDILRKLFIESGFSRVLVFDHTIDSIIGYVHHSDLFKFPQEISQITRSLIFIPETMPARKLLSQLIVKRKNIAIVVDEFGGTSGMVTIEDILEEIFGEIYDEHDTPDYIDKKLNENEFILSGRIEVDYLNEKYGLSLPTSESYLTLAGLLLDKHQDIPRPNTTINVGDYLFQVLKLSSNRIDLVRLKVDAPKEEI